MPQKIRRAAPLSAKWHRIAALALAACDAPAAELTATQNDGASAAIGGSDGDASPDLAKVCAAGLPQPGTQIYAGKDLPELAVAWPDGSWALAGRRIVNPELSQAWVERRRVDGSVQWSKGWQAAELSTVSAAVPAENDLIVGTLTGPSVVMQSRVLRLGSGGKVLWSVPMQTAVKTPQTSFGAVKAMAMALPDTLVVATSVDRQLGTLQEEGQVRALNPQTGELRWSRDFAKEIPVHLQVGPDGSSWIGFAPHGATYGPFSLRRLGADGQELWTVADIGSAYLRPVAVDAQGAWLTRTPVQAAGGNPAVLFGSGLWRIDNNGKIGPASYVWPAGALREIHRLALRDGRLWLFGTAQDFVPDYFGLPPIAGRVAWMAELDGQMRVLRERTWHLGRDRSWITQAAPLPQGWVLTAMRASNGTPLGNEWLEGDIDRAVLQTDLWGNTDCAPVLACAALSIESCAPASACASQTCRAPGTCATSPSKMPCSSSGCAACAPAGP